MPLPQMHGRTHCPGGSDPIPTACMPGVVAYAMVSSVSNQTAGLAPDVLGDYNNWPLTDGYSSDPSILEPDDTAIGIRVHEPGFIIATCRALGWNRWSGSGAEVFNSAKGS